MSRKLPQDRLAGFVLAFVGFVTCGFTWPFALVLNFEWICNPKRRHSIVFDLVGIMVCILPAIFLFVMTSAYFADMVLGPKELGEGYSLWLWPGYPALCLTWFVWVIYRSVMVWPQIRQNRREHRQGVTRTSDIRFSDPASAILLPGADPLDVDIRRIEE